MTEKDGQVTKRVSFTAKNDDEQKAAGIVMVPNKVDLHGDFERPETIEGFAEQFEALESAGEADGGVMHAVWPSDHISLSRNEIADADTSIGGQDVPEGAWVQEWQFDDAELWDLVDEGVLEGYSIGAIDVEWNGPMEQSDLPDDVAVAADYPDDQEVWELTDGLIREVSAVDVPAVPDAEILETKAEAEKRLADHLGNRDGFIDEAIERGHSEAEAERLWDYLQRAVDVEGSSEPGTAKDSMFARIGKAAVRAFTGSDDEAHDGKTSEAPGDGVDDAAKEGRTLSRQNRESLYATIDASLDILQDAGVDHGMTRFTDRSDTTFDLSDHSARDWQVPDEDEEEDGAGADVSITENAADGDTSDGSGSHEAADDMTDENESSEPPEWAAELKEQIDEQGERLDAALEDEDEAKSDDAFEDAPEWAAELKEEVDKQAERVDEISKQTGATESQQLGGAEKSNDETDGLDESQKFFIPESRR